MSNRLSTTGTATGSETSDSVSSPCCPVLARGSCSHCRRMAGVVESDSKAASAASPEAVRDVLPSGDQIQHPARRPGQLRPRDRGPATASAHAPVVRRQVVEEAGDGRGGDGRVVVVHAQPEGRDGTLRIGAPEPLEVDAPRGRARVVRVHADQPCTGERPWPVRERVVR
ncbi:hypothetical protein LP422_22195 [Janibacter limosus]|uniref:hypothetical protein n=1 Tax=Janibacter limosus TaxID=53458 RepID=UPI0035E04A25|nr:hypothetical protein LP422_22195 [Janibacter limosus]